MPPSPVMGGSHVALQGIAQQVWQVYEQGDQEKRLLVHWSRKEL